MKYYLSIKPSETAEGIAKKVREIVEVVENPEEADIIAAVGGDGSFLHTVYHYHQHKKPFVGINGGSLGFHCLVTKDQLSEGLVNITKSSKNRISLLEVAFNGKIEFAVQDIRIERSSHRSIRMKIETKDSIIANRHIGDGIIVGNSLGSTGYNLSAGGPILSITSKNLNLTPICPFDGEVFDSILTAITFNPKWIRVVPEDDFRLVADNREYYLKKGTVVTISRSEKQFEMYTKEER